MYIVWPTATTEVQALIGIVQYYKEMRPIWSYVLDHITETASGPKSRKDRVQTKMYTFISFSGMHQK